MSSWGKSERGLEHGACEWERDADQYLLLSSGSLSEAERLDCRHTPPCFLLLNVAIARFKDPLGGPHGSFAFRDKLLTLSVSQTSMPSGVSSAYRLARRPA